jgi:hypothetical protein
MGTYGPALGPTASVESLKIAKSVKIAENLEKEYH